ncbi:MAG: tetratricopeptide repeat protein [Candidatus Brocadiales bacterium]|nr:tetratricopeptide repeat protein [Candidatus Brocadiales bacterium]
MTTRHIRLRKILPIIIILISALLYLNTLSNTFVYDDAYVITENYFIKSWGNLPKLFTKDYLPFSGELSYRPIVTLTYFFDYAIWRLNPIGYHLTNVILHTINVFLFYLFMKSISRNSSLSILATLLFLSHPLLTETVNAVCYREDILASIFFLLSFIYFTKILVPSFQAGTPTQQTNTRFVIYYIISCGSFFLALFSKEMAITLPILLVLFDLLYCFPNKIKSLSPANTLLRLKRRFPFYSGYISVAGFYLFIRFVEFKNTFKTIDVYPTNIFTMTKVVASYLKLLFIPINLNADYYIPDIRGMSISFILSSLFIVLALIIIVRFYKRNKLMTFFALWFFITLLPVLGFIPIGNIMAERYLYLPIIGFCGATGCLVTNSAFRKKGIIIIGIIILSMQFGVIWRNGVWRDDTTLWLYTYQRESNSARACSNLGNTYFKNKQYEAAIQMYRKSLLLPYSYPFIHFNLGAAYEKVGLVDKAIEEYKASISRNNDNTLAYNNLGTVYDKQGLYDMAIEAYNNALTDNPYFPLSHNNLGNTYEHVGNPEKAMAEYTEALNIDNNYADAHNNLGAMYLKKGKLDDAIVELKKTTQLKPEHLDAHYNLGIAYAMKGLYEEAIGEMTLAIKYNANDYSAHRDLGILYLQHKRDTKQALYHLNESLRLALNPEEVKKVRDIIDAVHAEQVIKNKK